MMLWLANNNGGSSYWRTIHAKGSRGISRADEEVTAPQIGGHRNLGFYRCVPDHTTTNPNCVSTADTTGFSEYCNFPRISRYSFCVIGLYFGGLDISVHSGIHPISASLSGATKYGIEYRARVKRSYPVKRS